MYDPSAAGHAIFRDLLRKSKSGGDIDSKGLLPLPNGELQKAAVVPDSRAVHQRAYGTVPSTQGKNQRLNPVHLRQVVDNLHQLLSLKPAGQASQLRTITVQRQHAPPLANEARHNCFADAAGCAGDEDLLSATRCLRRSWRITGRPDGRDGFSPGR